MGLARAAAVAAAGALRQRPQMKTDGPNFTITLPRSCVRVFVCNLCVYARVCVCVWVKGRNAALGAGERRDLATDRCGRIGGRGITLCRVAPSRSIFLASPSVQATGDPSTVAMSLREKMDAACCSAALDTALEILLSIS